MPIYDSTSHSPPAPVAKVWLRNPLSATAINGVELLIDSGADVTLLPRYAVEQLNLSTQPAETAEIAGFDGKRTFAAVVYLALV